MEWLCGISFLIGAEPVAERSPKGSPVGRRRIPPLPPQFVRLTAPAASWRASWAEREGGSKRD
eukprot:6870998-Pyramimonas_sp.AAC.1